MGEIADMMLEGEMRPQCGEFNDGPPQGFPVLCPRCAASERRHSGNAAGI
jgi:hypothetical protein